MPARQSCHAQQLPQTNSHSQNSQERTALKIIVDILIQIYIISVLSPKTARLAGQYLDQNRGRWIVETATMVAFGIVLVVWLYGFSALLFRKPRAG
jgi:hypothetical protein